MQHECLRSGYEAREPLQVQFRSRVFDEERAASCTRLTSKFRQPGSLSYDFALERRRLGPSASRAALRRILPIFFVRRCLRQATRLVLFKRKVEPVRFAIGP